MTEQRREVALIRVTGEVDLATAPQLQDALLAAVKASAAVELDLRRVTFIDCVGIEVLRRAQRVADRSACHLVVRSSAPVARLARLMEELAHLRVSARVGS